MALLVPGGKVNGDIEIEIGAGPGTGHYSVRVLRAAAGGEPVGTLELDVEEILSRRELLESTVLASAVARRSVPTAEEPVRQVGLQLFNALFTGPVYGMYRASLGVARQRGRRLRVVLRLTAPELAALPWEMLFDPETGTYLCRDEPLVRHVDAPYTTEPVTVRLPLRVLGIVAAPRDLSRIDVDAEKGLLAQALAKPIAEGQIELVWATEATWEGIHAQLLAGGWHVLHFVGHGDYDTRTDEGGLALVSADGRADRVEASRLADLLGQAEPTPQLVVLNSCSSGRTGVDDLFSGTATVLARRGISAVVAMQFAISDTAAIRFAGGFYTAIANGRSIDEAARSGRISILGARDTLEWVTPVLYVRGQARHLFSVTAPRGDRENPKHHESADDQSPAFPQFIQPEPGRRAELNALYIKARAELRLEHFKTAIASLDQLLTLHPGYADASELREKAQRSQQLADAYASAASAEEMSDWPTAVRWYGAIIQAHPAYRDAAQRKDACEKSQRLADLNAELRHHASASQWHAVLEVDAELAHLDPSYADPDGLTTRARAALTAEKHAPTLERHYTQARTAEDNRQWPAAIDSYNEILGINPAYRDAEARRDRCRQIDDLESELAQQVKAKDWPGTLATTRKLDALDPTAASQPWWTKVTTRARQELLAAEQRRQAREEAARKAATRVEAQRQSHAAGIRDQLAARLPTRERMSGPEHPDTLAARRNLAYWTGEAGDAAGARDQFAALLSIHQRVSGPEHPSTLAIRQELARFTGLAGDAAGARDQFAALLPTRQRVSGPDHRETRRVRESLAYWTKMARSSGTA